MDAPYEDILDNPDFEDVTEVIDDETLDRAATCVGAHSQLRPMITPPVPQRYVEEVLEEADVDVPTCRKRLHTLANLARGLQYAGNQIIAVLQYPGREEEVRYSYPISDESVREAKAGYGFLIAVYERELRLLAEDLGVADLERYELPDDRGYDYRNAIQDALDYEHKREYDSVVADTAARLDVSEEEVFEALSETFGEDADVLRFTDSEELSDEAVEKELAELEEEIEDIEKEVGEEGENTDHYDHEAVMAYAEERADEILRGEADDEGEAEVDEDTDEYYDAVEKYVEERTAEILRDEDDEEE